MFLPEPVEEATFREESNAQFGALAGAFFDAYPVASDADAGLVKAQVVRDQFFGVQGYLWARTQTATGRAPVYLYNFNRQIPASSEATRFGAFHTGEVPYAYGNLHTVDRPYEAADHDISKVMLAYWVNFATTGNPNGNGLPAWPAFSGQEPSGLVIDRNIVAQPLPTLAKMRFWEQFFAAGSGD